MTPHPEELLDSVRAGTLSAVDRETLDRHLQECPACAFQLLGRPDNAALPEAWEQQRNQRAISAVMARFQGGPKTHRLILRFVVPAAAGLCVLGVASAALWRAGHTTSARNRVTPEPAERPTWSRGVSPEPAGLVPEPPARHAALPVAPATTALASAPPRAAPPRESVSSAADLFALGLELRDRGHVDAAIADWKRLQKLYPESRESRLSLALAGSLQLSRGQPREALALFKRHLSANGEASEEALAGCASAFQALKQPDDERGAWERLLREFPASIYHKRAEQRLRLLAASPTTTSP